ncbi:O-antigen ligase family protein [Caedibacter taeniospiralis]|uniref:O-antigen ligase family protein n=1 Tax=Caedibacter taeniospiralis TaxID=28907 RepID=UPI000C278DBE|nr:O-antigen ligase family protein [Caedibacter taeniospiralis]
MKKHIKPAFSLLIWFFLLLMFCGYFSYHNTAFLTIGAYSAFALSLIVLVLYGSTSNITHLLHSSWEKNKNLYITFLAYVLFLFISSYFFTYNNMRSDSIQAVYEDIRYAIILYIALFTLFILKQDVAKNILIILIVTLTMLCLIMPFKSYLAPLLVQGVPEPLYLAFRYGYVYPITLLFPCLLSSVSIFKQKWYLYYVIFLSIAIYSIVILSGGRGSFLTITAELILFLIYTYRAVSVKKMLLFIAVVTVILVATISVIYHFNPTVHGKVDQSFLGNDFSSGRVAIIETRAPIFFEHTSILFGTGYGNKVYQQFLANHHAPEIIGRQEFENHQKVFSYFHDEPQFLAVFYESGIIGLVLFAMFVITFLLACKKTANNNSFLGVLSIAIAFGIIGNTFVLGLVEHTSAKNLFLFCALLLTIGISSSTQTKTKNEAK